jgi:uncharacterized membrane protein YcjF (UPF0283 family)
MAEAAAYQPGDRARAMSEERRAREAREQAQQPTPAQDKPATSSSTSPAAPARSSSIEIGGTGVMNFWVVVAFALVIAAISIVLGHWSSGLFVALMAFLVMGALFPPVAIGIGAVVVLDLLLVHHKSLSTQLQSSLGTPAAAPPASTRQQKQLS